MAFDLEIWQHQAREHLQGWPRRMQEADVNSTFAFIAAAVLWPVVEAARAGDWEALAELGSQLLAAHLKNWSNEAEAARQLETSIVEDKDLLAELEKVLGKLAALALARGVLPDGEQGGFKVTLQAELGQLGILQKYEADISGKGAVSQGRQAQAAAAEDDSIAVSGGVGGSVVIAKDGAKVFIGEEPVDMPAIERKSALGRFLQHVISRNRYLQLQGIRSGGRLVHIELDQIFITLRATRDRVVEAETVWLEREASAAPGELRRLREHSHPGTESVNVSVNQALQEYSRLAVLGDPGSGKTTLLRYLALLYARDLTESSKLVQEKLGLAGPGHLPILLFLRQLGKFLRTQPEDGTEGHALLLDFFFQSLKNERIELPRDFFDHVLAAGKAVILLDGLDEVADADVRRRVSRLVEAFTRAYPACRYVVTSRIVGYTGAVRLGEGYTTTTVRDFTMADVEKFLANWHRSLAIGQMGPGISAEAFAAGQTRQLKQAVEANQRIRDLAINPLMLTVIAMVHRDRVKLPDRRAELYAEAMDVLLGKWDEARGVADVSILDGQPFDTGDRRLILQNLAFRMQEQQLKEIGAAELRGWLAQMFGDLLSGKREIESAVDRFLRVIEERTGLLIARGEGVYSFSHLTFQEYLAALAVAGRDDYLAYTLQHTADTWWREVILLEAGCLSTQSRERVTRLIKAISDMKNEPEPFHNLVLAAECLQDVGSKRVRGDLDAEVKRRLRHEIETPLPLLTRWFKRFGPKGWIERRSLAVEALVRAGAGFWTLPHGEPEWIEVPAGDFWMGSEHGDKSERPLRKVNLEAFQIARVPITNAQYCLFTWSAGHQPPEYWVDNRPPRGLQSHPVVNVSWHDARSYCQWLTQVTGKTITLPTEAQWEKASRGKRDKREYPWGDTFKPILCNSLELGLYRTTPVGIFADGASPYGCLDMVGNVWEWCRTKWQEDYHNYRDSNDMEGGADRVLRGGSFGNTGGSVRCAARYWFDPSGRDYFIGFRVVLLRSPS